MERFWASLWSDERGQDVAEYATIIAVIFLIAIAGARMIGLNFNAVVNALNPSHPVCLFPFDRDTIVGSFLHPVEVCS
jgi:Flp pilus assembly pilin Flp